MTSASGLQRNQIQDKGFDDLQRQTILISSHNKTPFLFLAENVFGVKIVGCP